MSGLKIPTGFPVKYAKVFIIFGCIVTVIAFLPPPVNRLPSVRLFFEGLLRVQPRKGARPPEFSKVTDDISRIEEALTVKKAPKKSEVKSVRSGPRKGKHPVATGAIESIAGAKFLLNPCLEGSDDGCRRWALDGFYHALEQTSEKKGITRIGYFGDSIIALDKVTSFLRTKFQERFGNSGPGFFQMVPLWKWLKHAQIALHGREWETETMLFPKRKRKYFGYGGVLARTIGPGATTTLKIRDGAKTAPNRMEVYYLKNTEGGSFHIKVDDKVLATVDTRGPMGLGATREVRFQSGSSFTVEAGKGGVLLLTGIVLERTDPGVVLDSMSLTGGRLIHFTKNNQAHFNHVLGQRRPNLIIFHFGINEADTGIEPDYVEKVGAFLRSIRAARPGMSCLIAGPSDKVTKKYGTYVTKSIIHYIIKVQKQLALTSGCAFFNTWEAMGGEASIVRWHEHRPRLAIGDLTHITDAGGDLLGSIIYLELMKGYITARRRMR